MGLTIRIIAVIKSQTTIRIMLYKTKREYILATPLGEGGQGRQRIRKANPLTVCQGKVNSGHAAGNDGNQKLADSESLLLRMGKPDDHTGYKKRNSNSQC